MPVLLGKGAFRIGGLGAAFATPPATPTNLKAYGSQGGAFVTWTRSSGAGNYDVQGSNDNSSWTDVSLAQANTTCPDSTGYTYYRVRAHNTAGTSAYTSGVASGSPLSNTTLWLRSVNAGGSFPGTWTDLSGNSHNATQATGGNQFSLVTNVLGGKSVVRAADANRLMNLPNIIPTAGSFTLVSLFKTSDETAHNNLFCGTISDYSVNLTLAQTNNVFMGLAGNSGFPVLLNGGDIGNPQTNWALLVVTTLLTPNPNFPGTGNSNYIYNNQIYMNNVNATAGTGAGQQGFSMTPQPQHPTQPNVSIGGIQGLPGFGFIGDFAEKIISTTQPTAAEINALTNMVNATYGLSIPNFNKQVLFIGDSWTNGGKATTAGGCWAFLVVKSDPSRYYVNQGYPGGFVTDLITASATALYPYTSCGVPTTCTVAFGTNDLFAGKTGAQVYADIQTLIAGLRTNGVSKVVVATMPPRTGVETERQNLNNLLKGNHSFADAFFDIETIPAIGAAGANTNTTYFDADAVHMNDAGHALYYAGIAPVIASVW